MGKFFPRLPSEREVHARVRCRAEDRALRAIKADLEKLNHADLRKLCKERDSFVQRQRRSLGHMYVVRDKVLPLSKQYPANRIDPVLQMMSIFKRQAQRQESFRGLEKTLGDKVVRSLERKHAGDFLERRGNNSNDGEASKDDEDNISNYHTESTGYTHIIFAKRKKLEPLTVKLIEGRTRNISGIDRGSRGKKEEKLDDMEKSADMEDRLRQKWDTKTGQGQQFMNQDKHSRQQGRQNRIKHRFRVSARERSFSDGDVTPTIPKMDGRLIKRTCRSVWNKINSQFSSKNPGDCDRHFKISEAPTLSHKDRKETIPSVGDVMNFLTERSRRAHEIVKLPPLSRGSIGSAGCKGPVRRLTVGAKPPSSWKSLPMELMANEKEREEMAKLKKIAVIRVLYQRQRQLDSDVQRRVKNFLESHWK